MENLQAKLDEAGLTALQKTCIVLHFFDRKSQAAIAAALGITQQAVSKHIVAGKARLFDLPRLTQQQPAVMTGWNMDNFGNDDIAAAF